MRTQPARSRVPQVNLLPPPERRLRLPSWLHRPEAALAGVAIVVWSVAAMAVAMLLGWHPGIGPGP